MRQVSRNVGLLIAALAIIFSSIAGLLVTQTKADAAVSTKASAPKVANLQSVNYGVSRDMFIPLDKPVELSQEYVVALETARQAGIGCSTLGFVGLSGTCRTVVDTVSGAVDAATEFMKDPIGAIQKAITEFGYKVIGGLVGWAGNGVISLVTSQHEECLSGSSGGAQSAADASACQARISMDYFPQGSDLAKQSSAMLTQTNNALIARYSDLAAKETDPAKRAEYAQQLKDLQDQNAQNGQAASDAASPNDVFYVPKSPVSSANWDREYEKYVFIGFCLMVPMLIAAALQATMTGKPFLLFRAAILNVPASIFGIAIAPVIVRQFMAITDWFCTIILRDTQADMQGFFGNSGVIIGGGAMMVVSLLPFLIVAIIFAFAAILIWFVLSMREASVALLAVFLPIAFAASIWPALSKWALRAIKLLVAAIISKVFIVGAISLGIGVFSGSSSGGQLSFSHLIYGSTIFFIAAFSPHLVMKFFDEIGDAINAAGGTGALARGLNAAANANGARNLVGQQGLAGMVKGKLGGGEGGGGMGIGGGGDALQGTMGRTMAALEGGKMLASGKSMGESLKATATMGAAATGTPEGGTQAAADLARSTGVGGQSATAMGAGGTYDSMKDAGASDVGAGVGSGMAAFHAGADSTTAGQIAYGNVLSSGGSQADAAAAQAQVSANTAPLQAQRDQQQQQASQAQAKLDKRQARFGTLKEVAHATVSPIHYAASKVRK